MNRIDNILVIVDPTADVHPAVEKAARLAQAFHARVELFACETQESRAVRYAAHLKRGGSVDFVAHVRAILDRIAGPLRARGIDVTVEATVGDPLHTKLLDRTQATCADLVVKDTHHHSIAKRTFMTNTDWELIRGCPVPLLLTKPKVWSAAPVLTAAVDPGHVNDKPVVLDNRILDWAAALRERLAGRLHVVHAYLPVAMSAEAASGMPAVMPLLTPEMMESERIKQLAELQQLTAAYRIDASHLAVRLGVASDALPRFADEIESDIMIMGAISRSGLRRMFIGSTAERVLEHLPCDVLVVRPPDFAADLPF